MEKTFSLNQILEKYNRLKPGAQVQILWTALDFMQQYNGRRKQECVALAMGYEQSVSGWTKKTD